MCADECSTQSLDRCDTLDDVLVRLARTNPQTKFIRTRASVIGFASTPRPRPTMASHTRRSSNTALLRLIEEEEDPYGPSEDVEEEEDRDDDVDVDTDMLPTMHVYRAGELVYNWVRVDWEAGKAGVEDLLERYFTNATICYTQLQLMVQAPHSRIVAPGWGIEPSGRPGRRNIFQRRSVRSKPNRMMSDDRYGH